MTETDSTVGLAKASVDLIGELLSHPEPRTLVRSEWDKQLSIVVHGLDKKLVQLHLSLATKGLGWFYFRLEGDRWNLQMKPRLTSRQKIGVLCFHCETPFPPFLLSITHIAIANLYLTGNREKLSMYAK